MELIQGMNSNIRELRRELHEYKQEAEEERRRVTSNLLQVKTALNRIGRAPHRAAVSPVAVRQFDESARAVRASTRASNGDDYLCEDYGGGGAFLVNRPKSLYVLWQEWESGLNGNKPARLYTAEEQGRDRQKYSRRKVIWDKILEFIRMGYDHMTAIDMIYNKEGQGKSVTEIINAMSKRRRLDELQYGIDV